jgi:hypothetical protein
MPAIQITVREIDDNGRQRLLHHDLQERETVSAGNDKFGKCWSARK